jgi:hypothetical protein
MQNWHEERLIIWTLSLNDPGGCFECLRQRLCHAHLLLMPSRQQVYWQGSLAPLWRQSALLLLLTFKVLENTPSRFDFWTVRWPGRRIKIHQTRPRTLKSGGNSLGVAGADRFIILREGDPPSRKCRRASHAGFVGLAGSYREGGGVSQRTASVHPDQVRQRQRLEGCKAPLGAPARCIPRQRAPAYARARARRRPADPGGRRPTGREGPFVVTNMSLVYFSRLLPIPTS